MTTYLLRANDRGEILSADGRVVGRVVPVEPTQAMITAARETFGPHTEDTDSDYRRILENGLSAAAIDLSGVAVKVPERKRKDLWSLRNEGWNECLDALGAPK